MTRYASSEIAEVLSATLVGRSRHDLFSAWGLESHTWPAFSAMVSRAIAGGPMSVAAENRLRRLLSIRVLPEPVETVPCPTCGIVHFEAADCLGALGTPRIIRTDGRDFRMTPLKRRSPQQERVMGNLADMMQKLRDAKNPPAVSRAKARR